MKRLIEGTLTKKIKTDQFVVSKYYTPLLNTKHSMHRSGSLLASIISAHLKGVNCRFWSHSWCLGRKVKIFAHSGIT